MEVVVRYRGYGRSVHGKALLVGEDDVRRRGLAAYARGVVADESGLSADRPVPGRREACGHLGGVCDGAARCRMKWEGRGAPAN